MNILQPSLTKVIKKTLPLLLLIIQANLVFCQLNSRIRRSETIQRTQSVSDTSHVHNIMIRRERQNADVTMGSLMVNSVDTSYSADRFLQSKKGCEFEKSIDDNGCVIIKYADGLQKKVCDKYVTEVITQDGRKHVIKVMSTRSYVMKIPPPPNPSESDNTFKWLNGYNIGLMKDIKDLIKSDKVLQDYLSRETSACNGSIYKEIEYRTIFLQEYLQAK